MGWESSKREKREEDKDVKCIKLFSLLLLMDHALLVI
jgi:hypothetical protein